MSYESYEMQIANLKEELELQDKEIKELKADNKEMREILLPMAKKTHRNAFLYKWFCEDKSNEKA